MSLNYKNILVAIDGSKESERAFHKAVTIAKRNESKLIIAHIVDTRSFATVEAYDRSIAERAERFANELVEDHKKEAIEKGLTNVDVIVEYGSPKVKIAKEMAPSFEVDLIICGATGLNAVERFFIGSVSEHITRYAKCDVLVVRREFEEN
ncbi:universal stress protein [Bacillus sp. Marseille-P3661]|uniref:universal stress protein n=1 Tax=Bacillus sp. Marseille-P3661 TaxID=1936234 RepID=UPI000C81C9F6|nr:universal stress protein [Bacillus sp. Marseille-P3661]